MFVKVFTRSRIAQTILMGSLTVLTMTGLNGAPSAYAQSVVPLAAPLTVKKVVNGKFAAMVDNGWVIYQGTDAAPTLNFYNSDAAGNFNPGPAIKLHTAGTGGGSGSGVIFNSGGIVFAPCPVQPSPVKCADSIGGPTGVGLGYGQMTFGGPGGQIGGWVNDNTMTAHATNLNRNFGSVAGLAVDPVNGTYAVGWDTNPNNSRIEGIVWQLDSATQTYKPLSPTPAYLGTLGASAGTSSHADAISKDATYVVGSATTDALKLHATYAQIGATSWTDITTTSIPVFPVGIIKSQAIAVSDTGFIAGSATVKRTIGGKSHSVNIGFVFNVTTHAVTWFEAPGANVEPLKVLNDGRVVGNLVFIKLAPSPGTENIVHPFLFDGATVQDFGTMTVGGQPSFGCRANRPNTLGELAGTCIPNNTTSYGVNGTAFYINATAAIPTFIDVNAAVHANADATSPGLAPYHIGSVSSIDDQDELTLYGFRIISGIAGMSSFIASKPAYNP